MRTGTLLVNAACVSAVALVWGLIASCSANSSDNSFTNENTGGTAGGMGAGGSSGGMIIDSSVGDGELTESGACVSDPFPGKLVPLDVYVLLDATGSMMGDDKTPEVWGPTTQALIDIISDKNTEGIGMGLTWMPMPPPPGFKIPGWCATDADCPGTTGPCKVPMIGLGKTCVNACTVPNVVADCGLYGPCSVLPMMGGGTARFCNGSITPKVSCDANDYGKPVVPIGTLPGNKDALVQAISSKDADGANTSTEPALQGALRHAQQWAKDNPSHLTHVLFATDGQPISCTTNSVEGAANVAEAAFKANPSVPTFVLGIGDPGDLNLIANKGGTSTAYMANNANVASTMVEIFNEIRANGACKFVIPTPGPGKTLNYDAVNVTYTELGTNEVVTVAGVGDPGNCDPADGGWYYDNPDAPTKILLCPSSCEAVKLSEEGVIVMLGCKTVTK